MRQPETPEAPQDLAGEAIIAVSREPLPTLHQEIEDFFESFGVELQVKLDALGPPEALAMVEQKLGICLVALLRRRAGEALLSSRYRPDR